MSDQPSSIPEAIEQVVVDLRERRDYLRTLTQLIERTEASDEPLPFTARDKAALLDACNYRLLSIQEAIRVALETEKMIRERERKIPTILTDRRHRKH